MSIMISEVYDAFTAAGAPQDKAKAAAEAVAHYDRDSSEIKASLMLIKWMLGFNLSFTLALIWTVFV